MACAGGCARLRSCVCVGGGVELVPWASQAWEACTGREAGGRWKSVLLRSRAGSMRAAGSRSHSPACRPLSPPPRPLHSIPASPLPPPTCRSQCRLSCWRPRQTASASQGLTEAASCCRDRPPGALAPGCQTCRRRRAGCPLRRHLFGMRAGGGLRAPAALRVQATGRQAATTGRAAASTAKPCAAAAPRTRASAPRPPSPAIAPRMRSLTSPSSLASPKCSPSSRWLASTRWSRMRSLMSSWCLRWWDRGGALDVCSRPLLAPARTAARRAGGAAGHPAGGAPRAPL